MISTLTWFKPSEQLPDDGDDVLFFARGYLDRPCFYDGRYDSHDAGWFEAHGDNGDPFRTKNVICWARPPELPKGAL